MYVTIMLAEPSNVQKVSLFTVYWIAFASNTEPTMWQNLMFY